MPDTETLPASTKSPNIDMENIPESNLTRWPGSKNIPIEQIIELRKKNLSSNQIAKLLNCSGVNVRTRLAKINEDLVNTEYYKQNRATYLQYQQRRLLHSITDADLKKANLRDKVISAAVLYDKERLETGQSTQNIAYIDMIKAKANAADSLQVIEAQLVDAGVNVTELK